MAIKNIGVLLFDEVELLDFAGPVQVFSSLGALYPDLEINLMTIGLTKQVSVSKIGMTLNADVTIEQANDIDLFIIPGGMGTRPLVKDDRHLNQIEKVIDRASHVASVCTGSLVLAKLGKLSGLKATTHFAATDILTKLDPSIIVDRSRRFHSYDKVTISEGVSAGIDMSFYLTEKWYGRDKSEEVRKYIEYYPEKS